MTLPIPRRHIPLRTQLAAALDQMGLSIETAELDHYPALGLRPVNAATGDYDPPQHDPRHLRWRASAEHKAKTFGKPANGIADWRKAHKVTAAAKPNDAYRG